MDYNPQPLNVDLSTVPEQLVEKVARNVHDQWACERVRQGWVWGVSRDDDKKEHPGIVPYDMLTDDEREVDRVTVRTVISSLLALGVKISI